MLQIYKTNQQTNQVEKKETIEVNSWIEMVEPTPEEIELVVQTTGIEKQLISKVLDKEEISRIEVEKDATLIVVNIPDSMDHAKKNKYRTLPLGIIHSNNNYFITIALKENKLFEDFERGLVRDFFPEKKTRFTIQLLSRIASLYLKDLNEMNEDIAKKEQILFKATKNQELLELLNIEKSLVYFMGSLKYNQTTLEKLSRGTIIPMYDDDADLLEDAMIENNQALEMANLYNQILASTADTYASIISNNLNVLMKFLAGITIVFSIPTMIASFMGMNVPLGDFGKNASSFFIIVLLSFILSILIAYWLKKKDML